MADEPESDVSVASNAPRSWHHAGAGDFAPDRRAWRHFWLIVLAALFLAFTSLAVVWLLFLRPPPPPPYYLEITISETNVRSFPIRPYTLEDSKAIARHFSPGDRPETKTAELLRKALAAHAKKTEPIVVHITALAITRDEKVFLLPTEARLDDESSWLDVNEVLDAVATFRAKNKLLILDLAHPWTDDRVGVLSHRVAETLEQILSKNPQAYWVLTPCSAGQFSWTSEAIERSAFAYYLDQGLQGHADADRNGRVTVQELAAFVEARVDRWAKENLGVRQQPRLHGTGADFVVGVPTPESSSPLDAPAPEPYPSKLLKAWQDRDRRGAAGALRLAARGMLKLDAHLLRHESLWRGGATRGKNIGPSDDEVKRLFRDIDGALAEPHVPPRSLALAGTQTGGKHNASLVNVVATGLGALLTKESIPTVAKDIAKRLLDEKDADFPRRASAVLDAIGQIQPLTREHVRTAYIILDALAPDHRPAEMFFVKRLADFSRIDPDLWRQDNIRLLLETIRTREAVVAALDREPELLPWIEKQFEDGDRLRFDAESKLFLLKPSEWTNAIPKMQAAREIFREANEACKALSQMRRNLNRSLADLPAYMALWTADAEVVPLEVKKWHEAHAEADAARDLFFREPDLKATHGANLPAAKDALAPLEALLRDRINAALKATDGHGLRKLRYLLDSPLLPADDRANLVKKARDLSQKLQTETDERDQDDNRQRNVSRLPTETKSNSLTVALARAKMSIALLRLAGFESKDKNVVHPATAERSTPRQLAEFERALQSAWSRELITQWRDAKTPERAEILDRIASPWAIETGAISKRASERRTQARAAFAEWLAGRYRAEAKHLESDREASAHYAGAARELER
ncbi:MAG: hypothetical protein FJ303_06765 [Planctomycetes bacterium]|nr:hypothetical protein [Planctomycetota bacterium]